MRVFLAAGKSPNQALAGSRIWYINLCLPLRDLGHEVIEFDFDLEPMYANADWHDERQRKFSDARRPTLNAGAAPIWWDSSTRTAAHRCLFELLLLDVRLSRRHRGDCIARNRHPELVLQCVLPVRPCLRALRPPMPFLSFPKRFGLRTSSPSTITRSTSRRRRSATSTTLSTCLATSMSRLSGLATEIGHDT